jgi:hypothetical protein
MRYLCLFTLICIFFLNYSALAQQADTTVWYAKLPTCPCRNPDLEGIKLNDGWAKDKGNLSKYHKGATASYRSYPFIKTSAGNSCQQCCYDVNGNLITAGRAVGTPDKTSACSSEDKNGVMKVRFFGLIGHYFRDVRPWQKLMKKDSSGWQSYNISWLPSQGKCPVNIIRSSK